MPTYTVTTPSGRSIDINAADPASAHRVAKAWEAANPRSGSTAPTGVQATRPGFLSDANDQMRIYAHRSLQDSRAQQAEMDKNPLQANNPLEGLRTVSNAFNVALSPVAGLAIAGVNAARSALGDPSGKEDTAYNAKVGDLATGLAAIPAGEGVANLAGRAGAAISGARTAAAVHRSVTSLSPVETRAVTRLVDKAKLDVNAMTGEQSRFSQAGVPPTVTDIAGNSGRRIIRANASRPGPASDEVQTFANTRALDLPDRIGGQARNVISGDPRTPAQIQTDLSAARAKQADTDYSAVRGDTIPIHPDAAHALSSQYGLDALGEAAKRETDPTINQGLTLLRDHLTSGGSLDGANMTVGMSDRVSRVLFSKAQAATRAGDSDLARTLTILGENVRAPAVDASAGYGVAQANYAAGSKLKDAGDTGEGFLKHNTDEFASAVGGMTPEQQEVARATARRAVERAAGENVGSAPGVARRIADAPEQQARNAALLGPDDAARLQGNMRAEADAVRNAQQVAPQTGPWTANNAMDQALTTGGQVAGMVGKAGRLDFIGAGLDAAKLFLARQGFNDQEAHALSMLAIDPTKTNDVLSFIAQRAGPQASQGFMQIVGPAVQNALKPVSTGFAPIALSGGDNAFNLYRDSVGQPAQP